LRIQAYEGKTKERELKQILKKLKRQRNKVQSRKKKEKRRKVTMN